MIPNESKNKGGIILQKKNYLHYYIERIETISVVFIA